MSRHARHAAVVCLLLAAAPVAHAGDHENRSHDTLTAVATGRVEVERPARLTDATIARAVERARDRLAPDALRRAREQAVRLGWAAGMRVGALLAVGDVVPTPFGFYDHDADGTFGPGRYCGDVRRRVVRRVRGRRVVRHRTMRTCRVPRSVSRTITATYRIDGTLPAGPPAAAGA